MMKKKSLSITKSLVFAAAASLCFSFAGWAASIQGELTDVGSGSISGWAWNKEDTNDVQTVEVHICRADDPNPVKYLHVEADDYRDDLVSKINDGWHGFSVSVDWSQLKGNDFKVKAYAVKGDKYYTLGNTLNYSKSTKASAGSLKASADSSVSSESSTVHMVEPVGQAGSGKVTPPAAASSGNEKSLGLFLVSGYCSCSLCSSGFGLTSSGTVPRANHTIAADLTVLPLGSRVRIGNTIYTVEDTGSSIIGNKLDIYFDNHASAESQGLQQMEVFLVQ